MKQIKINTQIKEVDSTSITNSNSSIYDFTTVLLNPNFSQNGQIVLDSSTLLFNDVLKYFSPTFVTLCSDNYFYLKEYVQQNQIVVRKTKIFSYHNDLEPTVFGVANGTFDIDEFILFLILSLGLIRYFKPDLFPMYFCFLLL